MCAGCFIGVNKGQELVFPHVDEGEENLLDWYMPLLRLEVMGCPDIHLSEARERELGKAQYLSTYSKVSKDEEDVLGRILI